MPEKSKFSDRDWREIAEQAAKEMNPQKLARIVEELCTALDKRNSQNQLRSYTTERKSA